MNSKKRQRKVKAKEKFSKAVKKEKSSTTSSESKMPMIDNDSHDKIEKIQEGPIILDSTEKRTEIRKSDRYELRNFNHINYSTRRADFCYDSFSDSDYEDHPKKK